jgi:hypothetical protein
MQIAELFLHKGRIALLQESKRGRSVVPAVVPIKAENDGVPCKRVTVWLGALMCS